MKAIFKIVIT